jgi:hypothetical protein
MNYEYFRQLFLTLGTENRESRTKPKIPRTELKVPKPNFFGTLFGSYFSGTEFTELKSVLYLGNQI